MHSSLLILGSGPAGCTAALYAARAGLNPTMIAGASPGGQLTTTTDVENWPGGEKGLQGPELMVQMQNQIKSLDTNMISDNIHTANLKSKPFTLIGDADEYSCDSLIVATGATAKYLGLDSEEEYKGSGVSACATCDGFFYRDQNVCVVGGGNTAVEEALYLAGLAKTVTLIHRRDKLRAEKIMQDRLFIRENIEFLWHHTLEEVLGNHRGVSGVKVRSILQPDSTKIIAVQGVFIAIGHQPNTSIFTDQLAMNNGYIITTSGLNGNVTETNIPGVFACGDVVDHVYRQAVTSAGFGCMAALDAKSYLDGLV